MTITEMCSSCMRKNYCPAAYKKEHWCGNHTGRKEGKIKPSEEQHPLMAGNGFPFSQASTGIQSRGFRKSLVDIITQKQEG